MDSIALLKWGLNLTELLACIAGFLHWKKLRTTYWKWFPFYLAIIFITELTAKYFLYGMNRPDLNGKLYLYFGIPVQFLFFFWLFKQYYQQTSIRNWPYIGAVCYVISWVIDLVCFTQSRLWFMSFSYTIGNIILLLFILTFFIRTIRSDEILRIRQDIMFWTCLGLLTFYLGTLPFFGLYNTLNEKYPRIFDLYWYIQLGLDYLMYLFFMMAFICGKPK